MFTELLLEQVGVCCLATPDWYQLYIGLIKQFRDLKLHNRVVFFVNVILKFSIYVISFSNHGIC